MTLASSIALGARLITSLQSNWQGGSNQRIYFANHTSHIDFVLIWASLPQKERKQTRPVAAADYWTATRLRRYLIHDVFHGVLVDRTHPTPNPISPLLEAVEQGQSLILFPEGTRGPGGATLPFKSGIFRLALEKPALELIPVWLENSNRVMPKGSIFPVPSPCSLTFGSPLHLQPGEEKDPFLNRLRNSLEALRP